VPKICDNKDFVKDVSEMFYKARIIVKEDKNYNKDYKMSVREILKILDKWNFAMQHWLEEEIRENEKNFYTFAENVFYYYLREYGKKECNNLSLEQLPMPKEAKPKNFPAEKFEEQFGGLHEKITEIAEKIYRADALVSVGSPEK
jgi:DNA-binding ferritin-like protein